MLGAAATPAPVPAPVPAAPAGAPDAAPLVDIPFEQFTLDKGLRVVVHTDKNAPMRTTST